MEDLIEKIKQWAHDRGIIKNSTPLAQSRKTIDEEAVSTPVNEALSSTLRKGYLRPDGVFVKEE